MTPPKVDGCSWSDRGTAYPCYLIHGVKVCPFARGVAKYPYASLEEICRMVAAGWLDGWLNNRSSSHRSEDSSDARADSTGLSLKGLEDGVHLPVHCRVHAPSLFIGVKPRRRAPDAFVEGNDGLPAGDKGFDFAIVKNGAPALVAQQGAGQRRRLLRDEVRGNMYELRFHAQCFSHGLVNLVPRQHFVRRDMKGVADGFRVAEQSHQAPARNPRRASLPTTTYRHRAG